ncbi:hypothetical protein [Cloacibacterium rupense]|uniref:hypothetical protein n=1 Tax=Cloacibacterium rupense TaxID=517423 RepID=UPI001668A71D|nr:hypothetical protein [Cloacibacterium rupense]
MFVEKIKRRKGRSVGAQYKKHKFIALSFRVSDCSGNPFFAWEKFWQKKIVTESAVL